MVVNKSLYHLESGSMVIATPMIVLVYHGPFHYGALYGRLFPTKGGGIGGDKAP